MTTGLILACCHCNPDVDLAQAFPFLFGWTLLFWLSLPLLWIAQTRDGERAMRLWPYGLLAFLGAVFALGFTPPLFLILPVFLFRHAHNLASGRGGSAYRAVARAVLVAMILLVPVEYLRLRLQVGAVGMEVLRLTVPKMLNHGMLALAGAVGLWTFGHAVGFRERREEQADLRQRRRAAAPQVAPAREHRERVAVQKHQACPLCWELVVSPGREDALAYCGDCRTVLHRDCADELGCCLTLGCRGRLAKRAPASLPLERLLTLTIRPRLKPVLAGAAA